MELYVLGQVESQLVSTKVYARIDAHRSVLIREANAEGSSYIVRRREASVVADYGYVTMVRLRVVLEPLCMFLFDKGFVDSKHDLSI